jgi:hypothetical protein
MTASRFLLLSAWFLALPGRTALCATAPDAGLSPKEQVTTTQSAIRTVEHLCLVAQRLERCHRLRFRPNEVTLLFQAEQEAERRHAVHCEDLRQAEDNLRRTERQFDDEKERQVRGFLFIVEIFGTDPSAFDSERRQLDAELDLRRASVRTAYERRVSNMRARYQAEQDRAVGELHRTIPDKYARLMEEEGR